MEDWRNVRSDTCFMLSSWWIHLLRVSSSFHRFDFTDGQISNESAHPLQSPRDAQKIWRFYFSIHHSSHWLQWWVLKRTAVEHYFDACYQAIVAMVAQKAQWKCSVLPIEAELHHNVPNTFEDLCLHSYWKSSGNLLLQSVQEAQRGETSQNFGSTCLFFWPEMLTHPCSQGANIPKSHWPPELAWVRHNTWC